MRANQLLLALAYTGAIATPVPQDTGSADCKAEPLNQDTWKKLEIENFLADWTIFNVSKVETNAVPNFANSFGAPNFFCGLDSFCNAGQPCSPNWNSYMNSLNTAITFASSIMSLTLKGIVQDFYSNPKDDITDLKTMTRVFAGILSIIPFMGPINTVAGAIGSTSSFSNVATSLGKAVQNWQSAVSSSFQTTIDAQVNVTGGTFQIIRDGKFLGPSGNITQGDMQKEMTRSLELYTIGLALQAQKVFVLRSQPFTTTYTEGTEAELCSQDPDGRWRQSILIQRSYHKNAIGRKDLMNLLTGKYQLKKETVTKEVAECVDAAGGNQLTYPFGDILPVDSTTKCIFNLQVCTTPPGAREGIITTCEGLGLNV
ncbi:hypothetical protein CSAL01_05364 [Colletotrichum salicis]|uniref:DUF7872 domain-containing protein n=1 Tax=Colletotrichum salicis TaxID=1209931 RepID=A0A135TZB8_9PEZI|nr:hypothetical protein CSAL01_05364 [Colletotrichum salicis]